MEEISIDKCKIGDKVLFGIDNSSGYLLAVPDTQSNIEVEIE